MTVVVMVVGHSLSVGFLEGSEGETGAIGRPPVDRSTRPTRDPTGEVPCQWGAIRRTQPVTKQGRGDELLESIAPKMVAVWYHPLCGCVTVFDCVCVHLRVHDRVAEMRGRGRDGSAGELTGRCLLEQLLAVGRPRPVNAIPF